MPSCRCQGAEPAMPSSPSSSSGWEQSSCPPAGFTAIVWQTGCYITFAHSQCNSEALRSLQEFWEDNFIDFLIQNMIYSPKLFRCFFKKVKQTKDSLNIFPPIFFPCCFSIILLLQSSIWGRLTSVIHTVKMCKKFKFKIRQGIIVICNPWALKQLNSRTSYFTCWEVMMLENNVSLVSFFIIKGWASQFIFIKMNIYSFYISLHEK